MVPDPLHTLSTEGMQISKKRTDVHYKYMHPEIKDQGMKVLWHYNTIKSGKGKVWEQLAENVHPWISEE